MHEIVLCVYRTAAFCIHSFFHSFIFSKQFILGRIMVDPEPFPGTLGVRREYTMDGQQKSIRDHVHIQNWGNFTHLHVLGGGRKLRWKRNLEETQRDQNSISVSWACEVTPPPTSMSASCNNYIFMQQPTTIKNKIYLPHRRVKCWTFCSSVILHNAHGSSVWWKRRTQTGPYCLTYSSLVPLKVSVHCSALMSYCRYWFWSEIIPHTVYTKVMWDVTYCLRNIYNWITYWSNESFNKWLRCQKVSEWAGWQKRGEWKGETAALYICFICFSFIAFSACLFDDSFYTDICLTKP